MSELGYVIGYGAGLFIGIAGYVVVIAVGLEAISRILKGR